MLASELFTILDTDVPFFMKKCAVYVQQHASLRHLGQLRDIRVGRDSDTLLHAAVKTGSVELVTLLLQNGCDVNSISSSLTLLSPLHCAVILQHQKIACELVAGGAHMDALDINGDCIFHYLARTGSVLFLQRLIAQAGLSEQMVQQLASCRNFKRHRLPEDVATNALMKKVMASMRDTGVYISPPRQCRVVKKSPTPSISVSSPAKK